MIDFISSTIPVLVLVSHFVLLFFLLALLAKNSWGARIVNWVGKHVLFIGLMTSLMAVLGSLFYSNAVGFEPCYLCWWQRVAIYPLLILFLTALKGKDRGVFKYAFRLAVIAVGISLYHLYIQSGGDPLIPCDAAATCSKLYVYAFGYISIPLMSLTIGASVILLDWANRIYENRHS